MHSLTIRTKFLGGFAALLCMVAALTFTSMRAVSSLNSALDRVTQRMSKRADRTSQLVETVVEISGRQQALLLRSILSDAAGVDQNRRAVADLERRIDSLFAELTPLIDSSGDRQLVQSLQAKAVAVRPLSEEVTQLVQKQQMNDALKIVSDRLLPAYEDLQRDARDFLTNQRDKMNSEALDVSASA